MNVNNASDDEEVGDAIARRLGLESEAAGTHGVPASDVQDPGMKPSQHHPSSQDQQPPQQADESIPTDVSQDRPGGGPGALPLPLQKPLAFYQLPRSNKFTHQETMDFLGIMEEVLPVDNPSWQIVTERHESLYPGRRTLPSLQKKFNSLYKARFSMGVVPRDVQIAKKIQTKIFEKRNAVKVDETDDDDDEEEDEGDAAVHLLFATPGENAGTGSNAEDNQGKAATPAAGEAKGTGTAPISAKRQALRRSKRAVRDVASVIASFQQQQYSMELAYRREREEENARRDEEWRRRDEQYRKEQQDESRRRDEDKRRFWEESWRREAEYMRWQDAWRRREEEAKQNDARQRKRDDERFMMFQESSRAQNKMFMMMLMNTVLNGNAAFPAATVTAGQEDGGAAQNSEKPGGSKDESDDEDDMNKKPKAKKRKKTKDEACEQDA